MRPTKTIRVRNALVFAIDAFKIYMNLSAGGDKGDLIGCRLYHRNWEHRLADEPPAGFLAIGLDRGAWALKQAIDATQVPDA